MWKILFFKEKLSVGDRTLPTTNSSVHALAILLRKRTFHNAPWPVKTLDNRTRMMESRSSICWLRSSKSEAPNGRLCEQLRGWWMFAPPKMVGIGRFRCWIPCRGFWQGKARSPHGWACSSWRAQGMLWCTDVANVLLREEILQQLGCIKHYKAL